MINGLLFLVVFVCLWAVIDSWERKLYFWFVAWSALLVYGIYVWTLL